MSQACSFVKSIIIARLISPENFGIAALFATTYSLLEMISSLAADKLLIQAKDGDLPAFQKTAQLIQVTRGVTNAAVLFLLAGPLSRLFGAPQAQWAFRCMALLPLSRGFMHLDMNRLQREMRFRPAVLVDVGSNVLVTLLALPLALWFRNYSAMLWLLVLQAVSSTVGSHLVAERSYGWAWDRKYAKRIFEFGWPLLINGLLMYGIFEGDRVIIGSVRRLFPTSTYTLTDLGVYSVAFSISMAPTMFVANVGTSLFLPLLSRAKESCVEFERRYLGCLNATSLVAAMIAIPFIFAGGKVVTLVYGSKYAGASAFIGWLAAMWAIRIIRVAPTVATMAQGDTKAPMASNIVRSLALVGMVLAAATGRRLVWISICGFLGELMALEFLIFRLWRVHTLRMQLSFAPCAAFGLCMGLAALGSATGIGDASLIATVFGSLVLMAIGLAAMLLLVPQLRVDIRALLATSMASFEPKRLKPEMQV